MLSERLAFILQLDASGAITGFQNVGKEADRSLGKADARLDKLGAQMTKVGAGMMAGAGVAATGLFKLGNAAAEQNAAVSALNQVLGESADEVEAWAEDSVRAVGLSERAALEAATSFGGIAKAAKMSREEVSKFAVEQTSLAADMAAFKNVDPAEAIRDLQAGYAGSTEVLRKYNIYVDDATLKAAYFRETGERVTGTLTSQQRIIAMHSEIMRQSADMQGQWNREAGEAPAQQAQLKASLEDFAAGIGQGVVPAMTEMLGGLNSAVGFFNDLPAPVQRGAGTLAAYGTAVVGAAGALSFIGGQAIKTRDNFRQWFTTLDSDGIRSLNKMGTAVGAAGLAGGMFALAGALDSTLNKTLSLSEAVEKMGRASDDELIPSVRQLAKDMAFVGSETELYEQIARGSVGTAERLAEQMEAQGINAEGLRQAIANEADAQRQANADMKAGSEIIDGDLAPAVEGLTGEVDGLAEATETADEKINRLQESLLATFNEDIGYRESVRNTADALDDLTTKALDAYTAVDDAKTPIDEAAQAQRDYQGALDDATDAALKQAEQALKTAEAQAAQNGQTLTAAEQNQILVAELDKVRQSLEPGHPLRARLNEYIGRLDAIPENVKTEIEANVRERLIETVRDVIPWGGGGSRRASGGDLPLGDVTVGEDGPERIRRTATGFEVIDAQRTRTMAREQRRVGDINVTLNGSSLSPDDVGRAVAWAVRTN